MAWASTELLLSAKWLASSDERLVEQLENYHSSVLEEHVDLLVWYHNLTSGTLCTCNKLDTV